MFDDQSDGADFLPHDSVVQGSFIGNQSERLPLSERLSDISLTSCENGSTWRLSNIELQIARIEGLEVVGQVPVE